MGESGVIGQEGAPVGGCGSWPGARLHRTGPGEVPMTCFTPTLALCRKNQGEVESQLERLFEADGKSSPALPVGRFDSVR